MSKTIWKAGTLLAPVPPTMVSCGTMENPNIITVAWTGIINSIPPKTYVSIRPTRYSHNIIKESGEFVINLTTRSLVRAADYCGVKSGKDTDKFSDMCLTAEECPSLCGCPMISQSPLSIACSVTEIVPLGSHDMFIADIDSVFVDERFVDKNGKLHLDLADLISYSHGEYFALGEKLGSFGFSVRKKKSYNKRK